jgi:hypothetical protein
LTPRFAGPREEEAADFPPHSGCAATATWVRGAGKRLFHDERPEEGKLEGGVKCREFCNPRRVL